MITGPSTCVIHFLMGARTGSSEVQLDRLTSRAIAEKEKATRKDEWGTFLAQRKGLDVIPLPGSDPLLPNPYAVIVVDPARHPHVKVEAAEKFADFLASPATQDAIGSFGMAQYGEPLFYPMAAESPAAEGNAP